MEHAYRRLQPGVSEIEVKPGQVHRHDQPLVGDDLPREAADVKIRIGGIGYLGLAPGDEQLAAQDIGRDAGGIDKYLLYDRQAGQRDFPANRAVGWHLAPTQHGQALVSQGALHGLPGGAGPLRIRAQEDLPHRVGLGKRHPEGFLGQGAHEAIGHLHQQAATITGLAVGRNPPAVRHAGEGLDSRLQQAMARITGRVGYQSEPAIVAELFRSKQACVHSQSKLIIKTAS